MTNYICITFGSELQLPNTFWNETEYFETRRSAERFGLDHMVIAGVLGYVVIEETEDSWDVVDEMGAPSNLVSISCNRLGTFKVQPSPSLALYI